MPTLFCSFHFNVDNQAYAIKLKVLVHPKYLGLLGAYINCQKGKPICINESKQFKPVALFVKCQNPRPCLQAGNWCSGPTHCFTHNACNCCFFCGIDF